MTLNFIWCLLWLCNNLALHLVAPYECYDIELDIVGSDNHKPCIVDCHDIELNKASICFIIVVCFALLIYLIIYCPLICRYLLSFSLRLILCVFVNFDLLLNSYINSSSLDLFVKYILRYFMNINNVLRLI